MLSSFSEFKFFQSFRIPVERADDVRFLVEVDDEEKFGQSCYIDDAQLVDISMTGLGFSTSQRLSVGKEIDISLQFKKIHLDLSAKVVRAFSSAVEDEAIIYGVELEEDRKMKRFLEQYIMSFSPERLKECLIDSALKEKYAKASDGFEIFSLLLSLFKDITTYGNKEGFVESMLDEVCRILSAQRASIFLINPDTNELEAVAALGIDKEFLRFDYRKGIAGSVFTTGVALNINLGKDKTRFNEDFDEKYGFQTKSIICYPIHNREDKTIGVIEVLNKRNQDRFTVEDEKTMKVLSLVFSTVFHKFNPISESSVIRRFSTPFDREYAMIGKSQHVTQLRSMIMKTKDIDEPVLIQGEFGTGKSLLAQIIHHEGQRGLNPFEIVDCATTDQEKLEKELFDRGLQGTCKMITCQKGTIVLRNIEKLSLAYQQELYEELTEQRVTNSNMSTDVRVIATSCEDLGALVEEGAFSKDLYELVSTCYIRVEPIRRRVEDIPGLVNYFLKLECKKQGFLLKSFSPLIMKQFKEYDWPKNVYELKKAIERSVIYNPKSHVITDIDLKNETSPVIDIDKKKRSFGDTPFVCDFKIPLKDRVLLIEREMMMGEIKRHNQNKSKAAKSMGISREALRKKMLQADKVYQSLMDGSYKYPAEVPVDDEREAA